MKNSITIIVPLYERVEHTRIFLKDNIYENYEFIFCDGGYTNSNLDLFNVLNKKNIKYLKFKTDKILPYDMIMKLKKSILESKTDFVMLADNDDFLNEYGINKCIKFLTKNKNYDYAGCDTLYIRKSKFKNKYHLTPGVKCSKLYEKGKNKINVINYLSLKEHSSITYYSIFKKKFLIKILNILYLIDDISMNHFEIFFNLLAVYYGNYKHINGNHYIRLHNPQGSLNAQIKKDYNILFEEDHFKKSIIQLYNLLTYRFKFSKIDARNIIDNYYKLIESKKRNKIKIILIKLKNILLESIYYYPFSIKKMIVIINTIKR